MQFLPVPTCYRVWRLCIPTGWRITGWSNSPCFLYSDTDIASLTLTSTNSKARMDRIHLICLLNSAACFLKAGELAEALKCCNQVTGHLFIWYLLEVPRYCHLVQHLARPYLHFLHYVSTPIHCIRAMKMQLLSCCALNMMNKGLL